MIIIGRRYLVARAAQRVLTPIKKALPGGRDRDTPPEVLNTTKSIAARDAWPQVKNVSGRNVRNIVTLFMRGPGPQGAREPMMQRFVKLVSVLVVVVPPGAWGG